MLEGDKLEETEVKAEAEIVTQPCNPQSAKMYRVPESQKKEVERQTDELLNQKILKDCMIITTMSMIWGGAV